jgi:hypothetical protein
MSTYIALVAAVTVKAIVKLATLTEGANWN